MALAENLVAQFLGDFYAFVGKTLGFCRCIGHFEAEDQAGSWDAALGRDGVMVIGNDRQFLRPAGRAQMHVPIAGKNLAEAKSVFVERGRGGDVLDLQERIVSRKHGILLAKWLIKIHTDCS